MASYSKNNDCLTSNKYIIKSKFKAANKIVNDVLATMNGITDLSCVTEEELLKLATVSKKDYYNSLLLMKRKVTIFYKRNPSESLVSPYNTVLLKIWQANMNIQYVTGVHGVIAYLTSYLCKPELYMSELMKKASKEASGNGVREQLRAIGQVFRQHREVSQHEAITRELSLPIRNSNIAVKYVPTGPPKTRTRMLKPQSVLEQMDPDDVNIFALNILDKYAKRPDDLIDMCLADFASNYDYKKKSENADNLDSYFNPVVDYVESHTRSTTINLKDGAGVMRKREKPCVIRWHSVSKLKNYEEYFLRILQLYLPWREEDELIHEDGTYQSKFLEVESTIVGKIEEFERYEDIDFEDLEYAGLLSSHSDSDNDDSENQFSALDPSLLECVVDDDDAMPRHPDSAARIRYILLPNDIYYDMCAQMNSKQRSFFTFIYMHAIKTKWVREEEIPDPLFVFLSGGAGAY